MKRTSGLVSVFFLILLQSIHAAEDAKLAEAFKGIALVQGDGEYILRPYEESDLKQIVALGKKDCLFGYTADSIRQLQNKAATYVVFEKLIVGRDPQFAGYLLYSKKGKSARISSFVAPDVDQETQIYFLEKIFASLSAQQIQKVLASISQLDVHMIDLFAKMGFRATPALACTKAARLRNKLSLDGLSRMDVLKKITPDFPQKNYPIIIFQKLLKVGAVEAGAAEKVLPDDIFAAFYA